MKQLKQISTTSLLFFFLCLSAAAMAMPRDTTIIEFNDKGTKKRVTVQTNGDKKFNIPQVLNLDNLLKEIGVDSNERKKAMVLIEKEGGGRDTILVLDRSGRSIKIIAKNPFPKSTADTTRPTNRQGQWDKETEERDIYEEETTVTPAPPTKKKYFSNSDFGLYLGLNNWVSNGQHAGMAEPPALHRWQSRYVALSFRKNATIVSSKALDLALSIGPEIAWYNFMFDDAVAVNNGGQVAFVQPTEIVQKSKLVMPYLNLPVLLNFGLNESKFNLGLGGYVGYRIGGYTKTKDARGDKQHIKGSYGMNDLFYGLTAEFGKRNSLNFFIRYDLTPMFKANQANAHDLQAWSFGVRL